MFTRSSLSTRAASNVEMVMPKIKAAMEERVRLRNSLNESELNDPLLAMTIDLATAENWLIRPEVIEICQQAISRDLKPKHFSYPSGFNGDPDLIDALCSFFNAHFFPHIPVQPDHIAVAPGCTSSLEALLFNICDPGDGILIPGPYWNGLDFFVFRARASVTPVIATTEHAADSLSSALIPRLEAAYSEANCSIRGLLLTNPSNPLGLPYPKHVLEQCVQFCHKKRIHLISDEIFALTQFDCPDLPKQIPFTSVLQLDLDSLGCARADISVVWSTSKDFGQSGIRVGCTITQSNQEVTVGVALAANTQVSSLSAVFATSLLSSPELLQLIQTNSKRLSEAYALLTACFQQHSVSYIASSNGLYVYARLAKGATTWEEEMQMVDRFRGVGLLVSPGRAYHGPETEKGWMRVVFAVPRDQLMEAIRRFGIVLHTNNI